MARGEISRSAFSFSSRVVGEEVLGQERDVLGALAQRRQGDGDHVQAVVEVLAEGALLHQAVEVGVGGGDDPHVGAHDLDAAQPHELLLLDHPQQLRLGVGRDVADLVEEDRAVGGDLEQPLLARDGAGERAPDVAEEVALQQVGRHGARVDGDERPVERREWWWIAFATSSLPVPLSPRIRMLLFAGAASWMSSKTCCIGLRLPMMLSKPKRWRSSARSGLFSVCRRRCSSPLRTVSSTSSFLNGLGM